ncbi:arginase family protein [Planococcus sp. N028]|uniref:Arginase family protein n=1 Tax=Planococcus shixiaomingii TaxID=3058393 RepID=A0ABT8N6N0_9BACL|nr:arginase family protein [Planococcus sp. N028]MDN7243531.1 arginase family protein [Planococcus sp. N028]
MLNKPIEVYEFPTNFGLRRKAQEIEPGVKALPKWLKQHGFYEALGIDTVYGLSAPIYLMDYNPKTGMLNENQVIEYAKRQAQLLGKQLDTNTFKLLIGGDCSILIGTVLALKKKGNYGLFFLDGHTDFITPALSQTGGIAGMDLAIAAGIGEEAITNIDRLKPYIQEDHIFCVGNREFDTSYVAPILDSKIHYFDLNRVRAVGSTKIVDSFLKVVEEKALDGFFIHLDVDVINDELMPAVDSREKDGFTYEELAPLLQPLLHHSLCIGIEITILDPSLDENGVYTKKFIDFFLSLLKE